MAGTQNGLAEMDAPAENGVQCGNTDLAKSYRKQAIVGSPGTELEFAL